MIIAICDDEKIILEQIKKYIQERNADDIILTFTVGQELLDEGLHLDIIFLDIQMEGMNGMEIAKELRKRGEEAVIIFITGIKEFVFEAFEVSAFHYLLKPIEKQKFMEVFNRAIIEVTKHNKRVQELLLVKNRKCNFSISQDHILYMESRGKKVEIHTVTEIIIIYASMSELEKQLSQSFYRCHRGYLVNMLHIVEYEKDSITLSNRETVFLAKERYHEFVKVYMRYLRNGGTVYG